MVHLPPDNPSPRSSSPILGSAKMKAKISKFRSFLVIAALTAIVLFLIATQSSGNKGQTIHGSWDRFKVGVASNENAEDIAMKDWEYRRALQYQGTGARIQSFLEKAKSGQPFTVSVIGGSVSKGRGLSKPLAASRNTYTPGQKIIKPKKVLKRDDDEDVHNHGHLDGSPKGGHPLDPLPHLGAHTLYSPENMHVMIFDWLNLTFPHPKNKFVNGAQGGVGSGYFGWCYREHIPEESDLVLIELGINDLLDVDGFSSYERLVRSVLQMDSQPAIINIETFTTLFSSLMSSSALHTDVAAFYDFPSVSIRDVLMPRITNDPDGQIPRWFRTGDAVHLGDAKVKEYGGVPVDLMHISALGHALAAGLVIRYLEEQIKYPMAPPSPFWGRFSSKSKSKAAAVRIMDVPPLTSQATLTAHFDPRMIATADSPTCRSMNSPLLHPSISAKGVVDTSAPKRGLVAGAGSHGWDSYSWQEKRYLIAREPGSLFSYPFIVRVPSFSQDPDDRDMNDSTSLFVDEENEELPNDFDGLVLTKARKRRAEELSARNIQSRRRTMGRRMSKGAGTGGQTGTVALGYQRSKVLGFGSVHCWVDEARHKGRTLDGWWDIGERNMGIVSEIATDLSPGPHVLHCELLDKTRDPNGGKEFRIFAVMNT